MTLSTPQWAACSSRTLKAGLLVMTLVTIASFGHVRAAEQQHVVTLTTDNFDNIINENENVLVEFYAPWCGHCKRLEPEYEDAAKRLKDDGSKVVLGKLDATAESTLADRFEIRGYPTLKLFKKSDHVEYTGGRTADTIVEWLAKMTGPAYKVIAGDIKEELKKGESAVSIVAEVKNAKGDVFRTFEKVADSGRHFGHFLVSIKDEHDKDRIYVSRMEEGDFNFQGKLTGETDEEMKAVQKDVLKFVQEESFPYFGPINADNFKSYSDREQDLVWFTGDQKHYDEHKKAVRDAAKEFRKNYSFVWLDSEKFKGHAEGALGVQEFPSLVYQSKKGRFLIPDPSAALKESQKIIQFFKDVESGKIERSIKSEPIPEKNDEPVKVVVGKTFDELVLQENKDVMLEVYAPWCGHCKNLEPIFTEFAEKLAKLTDSVIVTKMDGTANESTNDDFDWTGFPTLFFVKAGSKKPMKYEGGRTVDALLAFVATNATKKFEAPAPAPAGTAEVEKDEL